MSSGLKARTCAFMKGRFPTHAPISFCSPAPGLHVVPSRTAPGVCSILRLFSSQLHAALATHPPLQPNGAVPVATCGTIAPCTERQALLLALAHAPREQACAKGRARRWGTLAMSGKALPCALGSQLQTRSHHGTVPPFRGLLPLCLLRTILAETALMTVSPPTALSSSLNSPIMVTGALLLRFLAAGLRLLIFPLAILCCMIHRFLPPGSPPLIHSCSV